MSEALFTTKDEQFAFMTDPLVLAEAQSRAIYPEAILLSVDIIKAFRSWADGGMSERQIMEVVAGGIGLAIYIGESR